MQINVRKTKGQIKNGQSRQNWQYLYVEYGIIDVVSFWIKTYIVKP